MEKVERRHYATRNQERSCTLEQFLSRLHFSGLCSSIRQLEMVSGPAILCTYPLSFSFPSKRLKTRRNDSTAPAHHRLPLLQSLHSFRNVLEGSDLARARAGHSDMP